jgi:hypothetical protein
MKSELSNWYVASIMPPKRETHVYMGWHPCIQWCQEQFGDRRFYLHNSQGGERWRFIGEGVFEFKEEKDYEWFLLRWA